MKPIQSRSGREDFSHPAEKPRLLLRRATRALSWLLLALVLPKVMAAPAEPRRVIFDTDIMGDVDDVGAVAVLHALADAGEAEILAMGVSATNPWSPLCLSALNHYFGRPELPIGVLKGPGFGKQSKYVRALAEEFPRQLESAAAAPDVVRLYRQTLAAQTDGSVVFISVGMLTNVRNLLQSCADEFAPWDGRELVRRKVKLWVCMGGRLPEGREYNFYKDAAAAHFAVREWPGPAVFSGYEIGSRIRTGARTAELPQDSLVRRAYDLYNGLKDRQSWDQTAVLFAIRGQAGDLWELRTGGTMEVIPQDGSNRWNPAAASIHSYLIEKAKPEHVARVIEDLMLKPPKQRTKAGDVGGKLPQEPPRESNKSGNVSKVPSIPDPARSPVDSAAREHGTSTNRIPPEPLPWIEGSTTLVVLPDTETYCQKRPQLLEAQTKWIADNARARNIAYVLHEGDIVHDDVEAQWKVAQRCFQMLDGKVPYALVLGNHDYAGGPRTTTFNRYFSVEDFQKWPTFGGVREEKRMENSYHLCRFAGRDWIILALEFGPRDAVVAWANQILDKHPDRLGILVTHAYLFRNNTRYDHTVGKQRASPHGAGNDGEELWQKLVRKHANMMLVFSGHVATGGIGYLASAGDHGNTVHQLMVDYESMKGGGGGYLRLVEFLPDEKTVQVKGYSPALKQHLTDAGNQFAFTLKFAEKAR